MSSRYVQLQAMERVEKEAKRLKKQAEQQAQGNNMSVCMLDKNVEYYCLFVVMNAERVGEDNFRGSSGVDLSTPTSISSSGVDLSTPTSISSSGVDLSTPTSISSSGVDLSTPTSISLYGIGSADDDDKIPPPPPVEWGNIGLPVDALLGVTTDALIAVASKKEEKTPAVDTEYKLDTEVGFGSFILHTMETDYKYDEAKLLSDLKPPPVLDATTTDTIPNCTRFIAKRGTSAKDLAVTMAKELNRYRIRKLVVDNDHCGFTVTMICPSNGGKLRFQVTIYRHSHMKDYYFVEWTRESGDCGDYYALFDAMKSRMMSYIASEVPLVCPFSSSTFSMSSSSPSSSSYLACLRLLLCFEQTI
jgi:hypothetical protein